MISNRLKRVVLNSVQPSQLTLQLADSQPQSLFTHTCRSFFGKRKLKQKAEGNAVEDSKEKEKGGSEKELKQEVPTEITAD